MKNYSKFASLVMVIACSIISCSKKTDPAPTQASLLIGSWNQVSSLVTGCANPGDNEPLTNCTTNCESTMWTATTLQIIIPTIGLANYSYIVSGNVLTITPNAPAGKYTFIVSGRTLTLTFSSVANGGCTYVVTFARM